MSDLRGTTIIILDPGDARRRAIMHGLVPKGDRARTWRSVGLAWPGDVAQRQADLMGRAMRSATKASQSGIKAWVMAAQTRAIEQRLSRLKHPMTFLVWNGLKGHRGVLTALARAKGHRVVQIEEAPLPGRLQLSSRGVNADLPLPRDADFYRAAIQSEGAQPARPILDTLRATLTPRPSRHQGVDQASGAGRLPDTAFLFCPLQVPGDSQLTLHGGAVRDMPRLLNWLAEAAQVLPEGWHIRVKEHPSARISLAAEIAAVASDRLICDNTTSSLDQLRAARGLITVNSSMGLQAMLFDTPVIVIGQAFWAFEPLATPAPSLQDLRELCHQPDDLRFDAAARGAFLTFLSTKLFPLEQEVVEKSFDLNALRDLETRIGLAPNAPKHGERS